MFSLYLLCYLMIEVSKLYIIISLLSGLMLATSCASTINISSVAEKNKDGEFLLKWEVSPEQDGKIEIYSSSSDSSVDSFVPVTSANVSDQVARINPMGSDIREFFILRTSGVYSGIVSNRVIEMNHIKNFRDLGGYFNTENKQIRWGKLFRSGDLSSSDLFDQDRMKKLQIKTIIDFRSEKNTKLHPLFIHPSFKQIRLPIALTPMDMDVIEKYIDEKQITRSDAIRSVQDSYIGIIENYKREFADMFDILTDYNNYPVLLAGSLGKDRVGIASFLILSVLGVPENTIMEDYMLSNKTISPEATINYAQSLPEYMQEAITALLTVNKAYLEYTIDYIRQKYGSVDNYLQKELKVTPGKKILLRKYLLYNP